MPWFVEREPVAAIIEEWIARHEQEHPPGSGTDARVADNGGWWYAIPAAGAVETLAFRTGIPPRRLYAARVGEGFSGKGRNRQPVPLERLTFEFVERLLAGIGHPEYWHTRLDGRVFEAPLYERQAA